MRKVLTLTVLAASLVLASGCATLKPSAREYVLTALSSAAKPVLVVAVGDGEVLLRDARGRYFTVAGAAFASTTLKAGDILQ